MAYCSYMVRAMGALKHLMSEFDIFTDDAEWHVRDDIAEARHRPSP